MLCGAPLKPVPCHFEHFEQRPEQVELLRSIAHAISFRISHHQDQEWKDETHNNVCKEHWFEKILINSKVIVYRFFRKVCVPDQ